MITPFGEAIRQLRERKGVNQKDMASAIGVTPAYLSALEHGQRGKPSFDLLQRIAGYFNIIWDEADELFAVAGMSHPKVALTRSAYRHPTRPLPIDWQDDSHLAPRCDRGSRCTPEQVGARPPKPWKFRGSC